MNYCDLFHETEIITLAAGKCEINADDVEFIGHLLDASAAARE